MIRELFKYEALKNIEIDGRQVDVGDELLISDTYDPLHCSRPQRNVFHEGHQLEVMDEEYQEAIRTGLIKSAE